MATSNTYTFNPSAGEITLHAYNMIGVRPAALVQEHLEAARMACNLICSSFSNRGVNLWAVDLITEPLVSGTATYTVDASTVMILDAYIQNSDATDRIIMPVSRSEYASYPEKDQAGFPTVFWFDRLIAPTVTLWPVPDDNADAVYLKYYRVRRIQDAALTNGQQIEVPYLWMDAFTTALAFRLAIVWAPDRVAVLKPLADEAYTIAAEQNVENAAFYISPQLSSYWRP